MAFVVLPDMPTARSGHQMLAINNAIHVFDKYDSNENHLPKDFDIMNIPRGARDGSQIKWQQQELDKYSVQDREKAELVRNAGSV